MIQKVLLVGCLILVCCTTGVRAQINEKVPVFGLVNLERHHVNFNLLSPGISYEIGLFRNQSISTSLGLGLATYEEGYALGLAWNNRYRYYHNFERRKDLGKSVAGNSGDYIAAAQAIFFSQLRIATDIEGPKDFNVGFYGMVYGIQRTYATGLNFTAELGAGYYRGDGVLSGYGPLFHFTIGYTPKKKKKKPY